MVETERQRTEINTLLGTRLIPWAHDFQEDLVPTILRIHRARGSSSSMVLSIDSIRASDIQATNTKSVNESLETTHPYQAIILNNLPQIEQTYLLGSDPLSFMIGVSLDQLMTDNLVKIYAEVAAAVALGGSVTEAVLRLKTQEKTNISKPSRRDFMRLALIGLLATASGLTSRYLDRSSHSLDPIKVAEQLDQGIGVGRPGFYARMDGVDERTLLDSLKHRKAIEFLRTQGLITPDVASVSVWGNDHFLTDGFNDLNRIAAERNAAETYIQKGRTWLDTVLPEVRKILLSQNQSEDMIAEFSRKAYDDLDSIAVVRLTGDNASRQLEPVIANGSNVIKLIDE